MIMDSRSNGFSNSTGVLNFDDETGLPGFDQSLNLFSGSIFEDDTPDLSFMGIPSLPPDPGLHPNLDLVNFGSSSNLNSEMDSPDDNEFLDTTLKYLNQILMDENVEEKSVHDPLALQAAEKSLYEIIGENCPPSSSQSSIYIEQNDKNPNGCFVRTSSESSTNISGTTSNSTDPHCVAESVECASSSSLINRRPVKHQLEPSFDSNSQWSSSSVESLSNDLSSNSINSLSNDFDSPENSSNITHTVLNIFNDSQYIMQFKKGMEEAKKFLPKGNSLLIDVEKFTLPPESKELPSQVTVKIEKDERDNGFRGRKHHHREDSDTEDERSSKQSTVCVDEVELSEMFDQVLLSTEVKVEPPSFGVHEELHTQNGRSIEPIVGISNSKKQDIEEEEVDLRTLLINCAQSVAVDDRRTANEQLNQIRQHASPFGDGSQRLSCIFADALEARLVGTGSQIYSTLASKNTSATDMLKSYQLYISASPFKKIAIFFANLKIMEVAEKATKLHIVDFGILYGFQWPILIQRLSTRPGGPPKLRITGIDFPQPGFRPAERVEQTGRRLAKYCERFNVPFEYNAIAQKWQTIRIEDLKIESDEMLIVNSLGHFKNLLDETVSINGPRDIVLKLITKINPTIFLHTVVNGSFNAPFFINRFREALFYYSAMFDMFDANIPRDVQERWMFEKKFFGREVMNVIACEGSQRVERPETYKQWHTRTIRAGFRPLPLNQEVVGKLKAKVKAACHKDFVIEEDRHWMLQGWKGRIVYASSCWVPT